MRRENVEFSGEPCRDHLKTKLQVQVNIQDFIFNYQSIWFPESTLQLWKVHYKWEKNVQNDLVTWKLLARCSSCNYFIYKLSIISRNIHRANKFIDTNPETEPGRNIDWTSAKLLFYSLHLIYTQEFKMNIEEASVVSLYTHCAGKNLQSHHHHVLKPNEEDSYISGHRSGTSKSWSQAQEQAKGHPAPWSPTLNTQLPALQQPPIWVSS